MNCDECQQRVSEFVDEEIEPREIRMLFAHLASCDACWTYYRRVERLHLAMNRPPVAERNTVAQSSSGKSCQNVDDQSSRPGHQWLRTRHAMTPATFLLGSYVAFVVGVLLTLLLLPARDDFRQPPANQWAPQYYQTPGGNSGVELNDKHVFPPRNR